MARIIPNNNTWVAFALSIAAGSLDPTSGEITGATVLTHYLISINASSQGNVVPTPALDSLFETNIIGTSQASFSADFYRDDTTDTAWNTLARGQDGYFLISRFGGTGTANAPTTGDHLEVWPVTVVSRTMSNMTNNTVETFTVTCSVPVEPNEDAVVS